MTRTEMEQIVIYLFSPEDSSTPFGRNALLPTERNERNIWILGWLKTAIWAATAIGLVLALARLTS